MNKEDPTENKISGRRRIARRSSITGAGHRNSSRSDSLSGSSGHRSVSRDRRNSRSRSIDNRGNDVVRPSANRRRGRRSDPLSISERGQPRAGSGMRRPPSGRPMLTRSFSERNNNADGSSEYEQPLRDGARRLPAGRPVLSRSKSERYNTMRAIYRIPPGDDDLSRSIHSTESEDSSDSTMQIRHRRARRRSSLGAIEDSTWGTMDSSHHANIPNNYGEHIPSQKWLGKRSERQDAIINMTIESSKEKYEQERLARDDDKFDWFDSADEFGEDDYDIDAPTSVRGKTAFEQAISIVGKTAVKTKNAVVHPKQSAMVMKKSAVKLVKDPKKAALSVGKVTRNVTVGTVKVGAGLTIGATIGATKTVAKTTVKGAGKVAKRLTRQRSIDTEEEQYDSSQLAERQKSTLMDRIGLTDTASETSSSNDNETRQPHYSREKIMLE